MYTFENVDWNMAAICLGLNVFTEVRLNPDICEISFRKITWCGLHEIAHLNCCIALKFHNILGSTAR